MNSQNDGNKLSLDAFNSATALVGRVFEKLHDLFTRLWTPVQLLLALSGLIMAIVFGRELLHSLFSSQNGLFQALSAKLEPTRSGDQGIMSIVLSGIGDEWSDPKLLNLEVLNPILDNVDATAQELTDSYVTPAGASKPTPAQVSKVISELGLTVVNSGSTASWQTAITSANKNSFLVLPVTSVRGETLKEKPLIPGDQESLEAALEHNPELLYDVHLASKLELLMKGMERASGKSLKVVQTYFITQPGMLLISSPGVEDHSQYYGEYFKHYMYSPDRDYFWKAVDSDPESYIPTPFDYVTKPYLDLGGNGFVVTFSKKIELPNRRVGVLCIDAKLPDHVTDEIVRHLKNMGAEVSDFYWVKGKGIQPGNEGQLPPPQFAWFAVELNKSNKAQSIMTGLIASEPKSTSQARSERVVRFTVPVESREDDEGKKRTRLLWVEFNSDRILQTLTRNLVLFTAGIVLVIAVTYSLFRDYTVLKREMSNVLGKMSKVMRDAPIAFVSLNEKNEFLAANKKMLELLEYDNIEELRKHRRTFRGLITDATQETYDAVLASSGAGHETGEYEIDVITKSHKILHVRAHGESIPYPTLWRRDIPHRFGVFVEVTEAGSAAGSEPSGGRPDLTIAFSKRA